MTGFHPDAAFTTSPTEPIDATDCDVRGLRIALSADLGDWPTVAPVRAALDRTAQVLRAAGAVVDEVDLVIERSLARRASDAHCAALFATSIADTVRGNEHLADASTLRWLESIERAPTYAEGLVAEGEIWSRLGVVFDRFDALLCPAMCIPAYTAGVDHSASPIVVEGREWDALHDICPAEVFNATGTCPVLAVPIGRDEHGVPIGTQIVARPFDEPTVFRIAARLERDQPWPRVAPAPTAADRSDARGD
jgi:Asp-tRNA(Asn)/Glu-tRNA(Gln) amidotransferase A subunit family amidase